MREFEADKSSSKDDAQDGSQRRNLEIAKRNDNEGHDEEDDRAHDKDRSYLVDRKQVDKQLVLRVMRGRNPESISDFLERLSQDKKQDAEAA